MKQTVRTQVARGLLLCAALASNVGGFLKVPLFAGDKVGVNGSNLSESTPVSSKPGWLRITKSTVSDKVGNQPISGANFTSGKSGASVSKVRLANPGDIVISQIYGGGGNSGSTYKNDFIELFNRSGSPIDVTGWTVQYASTTGTSWVTTSLSGTILAGGYYLIQEQAGAGGTTNLPTVDATGAIGMSATTGKVALANIATPLSGSCPTGATVIDFVGYGTTANCFEGSGPTANLTNATAALRGSNGCTDANNNASDFTTGAANPRNSSSPVSVCGTLSPSISVTPNPVALTYNLGSGPLSQTVTVNASNLNPAAGNVTVTSSNTAVTLSNGGNFGSSVTLPYTNAGLTSTTLVAQLTSGLSAGTYSTTLVFAGGGATFNLPVNGTVVDNSAVTLIRSIQGTTHISPLNGQAVNNVQGIVIGLRNNGFYLQDPNPDSDDRTSEGIFVFQNATPTVPVGASVTVGGTVSEFRSGGSSGGNNLTTTQINTPTVTVLSTGNALPAATILGNGGRTIPTQIIEDQTGDVETSGLTFDPASDGIDFYESLEGMLVAINNPVTVSPTLSANTIWVLADNGANATGRTPRGGVAISASDFNPERILLYTGGGGSFPATSLTAINVNAGISSLTGVMDYFGGDYEVLPSTALTITPSTLTREASTLVPTANQLTVATFNVENLDPNDGATKFGNLASRIVNNLKSPDIINLEEIQDNNGATNNGTVDASTTFQTLINAITAAGGPTYSYKQIDPVNGQDGGEPGGNIRVGFLFNAARVTFIDRAGGTSTAAVTVTNVGGQPQLSFSPGRIDPTNSAFSSSRKPLVGEFVFNGQKIFVIANHFNSKGGDQGLFGKTQPPVLSSEAQRNQQATIVRNFVSSIQAIDPNASIVVAGDLNDFQFSNPLNILKGSGPTSLTTLVETLPANEQYTYNFGGNAQVIDHIMVSSGLRSRLDAYDVVHINSEFFDQDSDHDPSVARFTINGPDLSPIIRLPQANFTASGDDAVRNFIVELTEYGGQATSSGNIVITITAPLGYSLDYDNTRTTINVSGGTTNPVPVTNSNWSITSGASGSRQLSLTIKAGQAISALSTATLGFTITRTSASSASTSNLTVNVNDDATKTYDGNSTNNIFVRNINAL